MIGVNPKVAIIALIEKNNISQINRRLTEGNHEQKRKNTINTMHNRIYNLVFLVC